MVALVVEAFRGTPAGERLVFETPSEEISSWWPSSSRHFGAHLPEKGSSSRPE